MPKPLDEGCAASAALFDRIGLVRPWVSSVSVASNACVGGCAFDGAPQDGKVEIAYFTLAEYEGRGFASNSARALVDVAKANAPQVTIIAKTLPEQNASSAILKKLGLIRAGTVEDDGVGTAWLWGLVPQ